MKATDIQPGMIVQYKSGYGSRDEDRDLGNIYIGEVIETGLYRDHYSRQDYTLANGEVHRVLSKTARYGSGHPIHAVRLIKYLSKYSSTDEFEFPEKNQTQFPRSAEIVREWTDDLEKSVLKVRANHRVRETENKVAAHKAAQDEKQARSDAIVYLRNAVGDSAEKLLPRWAQLDAYDAGQGTLSVKQLADIVAAAISNSIVGV